MDGYFGCLKGSFNGDTDIDVDVDMDRYSGCLNSEKLNSLF